MKNYVSRTFLLTLIIFAALVGLYFLPSLSVDGYTLRKVDIFADIRTPEPDEEEMDSTFLPPPVKPVFVDTCKTGMTCIEDYSDSTLRGMAKFYEALGKVKKMNRPVRIAVFGDSFIEADIFTADLRSLLQTQFGGSGVGFIPVTSMTSGYRPTVRHSFGGWSSHCVTDSIFNHSKQGISGHYFIPRSGAYIEAKGQTKYGNHLDTCEVATLYFVNKGNLQITSRINNKIEEQYEPDALGRLQEVSVKGHIGSVRWMINQADSALFYGVAMDAENGICVDNFSLRGSSGLSLRGIPESMLREFNAQRTYDLIVLEYGLNVATPRGKNYDRYKAGMLTVVEHLKNCFPDAGILIMGVGDREYKTETGELRTMPGVKNLIRYQQAIAAESSVAFWNMYEAMGGEGSMAKMVHAKPSMANYDYTHINFRGGEHLAKLLYETLMYGKQQYDRRQQYETE